MQGSYPSQLSMDLSNIRRKVKRGHTDAKEPRQYTPEEMEQFQHTLQILLEKQTEEKEARRAARVNSHTTLEINRAIKETKEATKEAVQEGTRHSEAFFEAVGGAGSSGDLMVQGQAMIARAKSMAKDNKEAALAAAKATKLSLRTELAAAKAEEKQKPELAKQLLRGP